MKKAISVFLWVAVVYACHTPEERVEKASPSDVAEPEEPLGMFGEPFQPKEVISLGELFGAMAQRDSLVDVVVRGRVAEVCQKKGCWMTLVAQQDAQEMMVRFLDYGFFVPKDIAGRTVIIKGSAFREEIPVDELRHYAEDAGKSKEEIEQITEPEVQIRFVASGVLLESEG